MPTNTSLKTHSELWAVFTSVETKEDALLLAKAVLDKQLAACVHMDEIDSLYFWKDELQHHKEWRLSFTSSAEQYPALETLLHQLHPYELPAIYALPVQKASGPYTAWVQGCLKEKIKHNAL